MTDIKMSKAVVLLIGLAIIVGAYVLNQFKDKDNDGKLLIETFQSSGVDAGKVSLNGWKRITDNNTDDELSILSQINRALNPNKQNPSIQTVYLKHSTETTTSVEINPGLKAKLTIIKSMTNHKRTGERYLVISLEGKSTTEMIESMEKIYNKIMGKDSQKSIVFTGFVDGNLSPLQEDVLIRKMVKTARVQKVEKLETAELVSVTGYAPNVHSMLTLAGKSVNINMALRYNSVQNRTMVYVGSPVITSEY